jgi:hypothetical protein
MGGKGGGGGGGGGYNANNFVSVETPDGVITATKEYADTYYPNARKMGLGDYEANGNKFPDAPVAAPAAAAPEPEPEVAAPAPEPEAPAQAGPSVVPDSPLAPPDSLPDSAPGPGAGDALGGAVIRPPKYWTGGLDQYESAPRTGRGREGAVRTTQT